jgi:predicted nuclease with RNAse H fold
MGTGVVMGVDLAGNPVNASGVAVLADGAFLAAGQGFTDADLLALAREHAPDVIAVDAPLTPPDGRAGSYASRVADQGLRAAGFRAMPPALLGALTFRGMRVAALYRDAGFTVIEAFPRATLARLGQVPPKGRRKTHPREIAAAREALARVIPGVPPVLVDDHAADAFAAAVTARAFVDAGTQAYGVTCEGVVHVPTMAWVNASRASK